MLRFQAGTERLGDQLGAIRLAGEAGDLPRRVIRPEPPGLSGGGGRGERAITACLVNPNPTQPEEHPPGRRSA